MLSQASIDISAHSELQSKRKSKHTVSEPY